MVTNIEAGSPPVSEPRQRILDTAYDLFSHRGIRGVGVDELIERAEVAKATFYRHFPSKDDLVLAFLRQREQVWTHGWVEAQARARGSTPEAQLLAIFDLLANGSPRMISKAAPSSTSSSISVTVDIQSARQAPPSRTSARSFALLPKKLVSETPRSSPSPGTS